MPLEHPPVQPVVDPEMTPPSDLESEASNALDFNQCLNIEELYALTDEMERKKVRIQGSSGGWFDHDQIRNTIANVRKAREQGMDEMARLTLRGMTNKHGVRDAIQRIVWGDALVGYRDRLEKSGQQPSATNLDIHV